MLLFSMLMAAGRSLLTSNSAMCALAEAITAPSSARPVAPQSRSSWLGEAR